MSPKRRVEKSTNATIDYLLGTYGHVNQDSPLEQLLAAEEAGMLPYPTTERIQQSETIQ